MKLIRKTVSLITGTRRCIYKEERLVLIYMKTAIVNVSFGSWYPKWQKRLAKSLTDNGFSGDMLLYNRSR